MQSNSLKAYSLTAHMNNPYQSSMIHGGCREEAVTLSVAGQAVRGILAAPAAGGAATAVVMVHGWGGSRQGPHDLITDFARGFAQAGIASLRFDLRGRGESDGTPESASLPTMADDLAAAVACCRERGYKKIVLWGLCSGGNVIIGTLPRLGKIEALLLFSVYPFSDGDSFGRSSKRTLHHLGEYLRKAVRLETWRRLVRGDINLKMVFKVLSRPFLKRGENAAREQGVAAPKPASPSTPSTAKTPAPTRFLDHLRADLPAFMVYGENDPDTPASLAYYRRHVEAQNLPVRFLLIPGANHNFSSVAWTTQLCGDCVKFLGQKPERP
jgi:pimeloyl-ACP methyl ester carboxylesterase